jgi:ABC-2 type transport system permease protein
MKRPRWTLIREQMLVQLRVATLNLWMLGLYVVQPAVFVAVGMLLSRAAGNAMPDLVYSVIGAGIMGMWSGLVFTSTFDIAGDRWYGTLELIVGSPTPLATVEGLRTLTNVLAGLFSLLLALGAAMLIFGYSLAGANLWGAGVSLLVLIFAMWCLGVFMANFLAWSRLNRTFVDYLEMPVAFLCGFMYPIQVLPEWLQAVSSAIPIRWALQGLNESLLGNDDARYLAGRWAMAIGTALVFLIVTRQMQRGVHDAIRVSGELSSA